MGATESLPWDTQYNDPQAWSLDQVREMYQVWRDELQMSFGINKAQLRQMITGCSFADGLDFSPLIDRLWKSLNPDDAELIDALGVICAFAVVSQGGIETKSDFVFQVFDFNESGSISEDELTILVMASVLGVLRFYRPRTPIPPDSRFEAFTQKAFASIDSDQSNTISRHEFKSFLSDELDADHSGTLSVDELLAYFGCLVDGSSVGGTAKYYDPDLELEHPQSERKHVSAGGDGDFGFTLEDDGTGDQFMAVKPWLGAIVAPTSDPPGNNSAPDADLSIEWVYGYRCFDARNNVRQLATGEIVYHTAAVGIVYNPTTHKQRHYLGHSDDVICLALHPDGRTVATGQMGSRPTIHVWDATAPEGKQLIAVLKARTLQRACLYLSFSPDGSKLAAVGQDDDHTLHVFTDWKQGTSSPVLTAETDKSKILDLAFGDSHIVTVGDKHVTFWDTRGRVLKAQKGQFSSNSKAAIQPVVSAAWFGGRAVTGTVSGHLYVWKGAEIEAVVRAHDETVNSLYVAGDVLVSGGKDAKINQWNGSFNRVKSLETKGRPVRSVFSPDGGNTVLAGLANADIVVLDPSNRETLLVEGHFYGELWALAVHPTNSTFATACDDKTLRVWDRVAHKCISKVQLDT